MYTLVSELFHRSCNIVIIFLLPLSGRVHFGPNFFLTGIFGPVCSEHT